jgi:hypothetical protein
MGVAGTGISTTVTTKMKLTVTIKAQYARKLAHNVANLWLANRQQL